MMRSGFFLLPALVTLLSAPQLAAEDRETACRARAEKQSGYQPPLLQGQVGDVRFRLGGSAAVGVSRSSGATPPAAPPFAGAAHRERFEAERNKKRADLYQRLFDACMGEGED